MTAGMRTIGKKLLGYFNVLGHVYKRSEVKPKRVDDPNFRSYYASTGKCTEDISTWRNATFSGVEQYDAFKKYAHPEPVLTDEQSLAFELAVDWMEREFYPYMSGSSVLSEESVIAATEASNSPGYPWNQCHGSCQEFYSSDDKRLLGEYWERCQTLSGSFTLWNSFLKEELRKIVKIQTGDIRQINGCSVEFKTALNRLCLEMNERFYQSHLRSASCVGLNKFRGGWNRLYRKLAVHSKGFSFDVKRWDSHFPRLLMEAIRDFRWNCLSQVGRSGENRARFYNLYEQIIESATVMSWGEVLQTKLGNPSGSPNTVVDNTLGLYILCAYCYIRSASALGIEPEYTRFNSSIALALYGDDNTFTGSEEGLRVLNFQSMRQYADELGFQVTDGGCDVPRPVMELDFLSTSFVRLKNGFVVFRPKDRNKALASMAFRHDGDVLNDWSRACSFRINAFYDRETFDLADGYCQYLRCILDTMYEHPGSSEEWVRRRCEYVPESKLLWLYCSVEGRA